MTIVIRKFGPQDMESMVFRSINVVVSICIFFFFGSWDSFLVAVPSVIRILLGFMLKKVF